MLFCSRTSACCLQLCHQPRAGEHWEWWYMGAAGGRRLRLCPCCKFLILTCSRVGGTEGHRDVKGYILSKSTWQIRAKRYVWIEDTFSWGSKRRMGLDLTWVYAPQGLLRGEFLIHGKMWEPPSVPLGSMMSQGSKYYQETNASGLQPLPFSPKASTRAGRGGEVDCLPPLLQTPYSKMLRSPVLPVCW